MSPKLMVTTTATTVVKLKTSTKLKLQTTLKAYQAASVALKELKVREAKLKAEVERLRETTGESKLELDGFKITLMDDQRVYKLDKMRFVELGGDLNMLEEATTSKPKKPYTLVTCPGEKERSSYGGEE